jgi:uncharacterized protein (TIGR02300 family)
MPAKELGSKFVCFKCSTKFYDLKKPVPVCPKCGADQRDSPALRPQPETRRGRLSAAPKVVEPVPVEEAEPVLGEEEEDLDGLESDDEVVADDED